MNYNTDGIERLQELIGPDYKLQWVIGQGGMSTVWLADDLKNQREVAVKVLRPEFADNNEFLSRFRNEAETAEGINHPNVVQTYDYREVHAETTYCFIIMEYIRGESLADLIAREGAIPEDRALNILEQAAYGLATIHSMNLVHRDIKPGNIMITPEDRVKITDFGIAKAAAAVPLTRTGMVVGTAQYVSPEQAQGMQVTAASDVYSLGVVGYEMLAGKRPFTGDSSVSVAISHINSAPPPLPVSVSAPTRELIAIALRKDPARRFREGGAFARAISQARLGQPPLDPSPGDEATSVFATPTQTTTVMPVRTPAEALASAQPTRVGAPPRAGAAATSPEKKKSSSGWIAAVALLALVLGGGGAWAFLNSTQNEKPQPVPAPITSEAPSSSSVPKTTTTKTTTSTSSTTSSTSTKEAPRETTIYFTPEAPPTSAQAPVTTTKSKTTKPQDPKVSVPDAPLPTELVQLPSLGGVLQGNGNGNGNGAGNGNANGANNGNGNTKPN